METAIKAYNEEEEKVIIEQLYIRKRNITNRKKNGTCVTYFVSCMGTSITFISQFSI
jgi:hypothetical protein